MTTVVELHVVSAVEPWERLGLTVHDRAVRVGGITLRFTAPGDTNPTAGVVGWTLADAPDPGVTQIDGLPTTHGDAPADAPPAAHARGIHSWDHLVVMTSSIERTCEAIEAATGAPLKRIREAGPIRQGFHRLGELIIEVVESAQVTAPHASFWGFVWNVPDLHEVCGRLGPEVISLPKPAVQPGRFIATVRPSLGLGVPLALMTPASR